MIRRVMYRKAGMREIDTLRLVQALVISRITYCLPYQILNKEEERQANAIIRTAFKAALGLPKSKAPIFIKVAPFLDLAATALTPALPPRPLLATSCRPSLLRSPIGQSVSRGSSRRAFVYFFLSSALRPPFSGLCDESAVRTNGSNVLGTRTSL